MGGTALIPKASLTLYFLVTHTALPPPLLCHPLFITENISSGIARICSTSLFREGFGFKAICSGRRICKLGSFSLDFPSQGSLLLPPLSSDLWAGCCKQLPQASQCCSLSLLSKRERAERFAEQVFSIPHIREGQGSGFLSTTDAHFLGFFFPLPQQGSFHLLLSAG